MEVVQNRWANSDIEHHTFANINAGLWFQICCSTARHWIVLRKADGGGGGTRQFVDRTIRRQIVRQLVNTL